MRVVNDVTGMPIKAQRHRDRRAGQRRARGVLRARGRRTATSSRGTEGVELQNAKAKAAVIVVRMQPDDITPSHRAENWGIDGILCYSKICTHVGCPISLWEQQTHHLLCPCHQSTFDLADNGKVIFGPAARPLPQLPDRCSTTRGTSSPSATSRSPSDRATGNEGDRDEHTTVHRSVDAARPRRGRAQAQPVAGPVDVARRPDRARRPGEEAAAQGLPRPLVVHARRDRAVELRRPAADRRLPVVVVQAEHGRGRVHRAPTPSCAASRCRRPTRPRWTSRSTSAAACSCGRCTTGRPTSSSPR